MANLIGSGINQISVNGMLGNLAFQDKAYVSVDAIGIGTTFVDSGTVGQALQVTGGAYVSGSIGIGTTNPTSKLSVVGDVLVSGIVTATTFIGNLTGTATTAGIATYATTAGIATYATTSGVSTSVIGGIGSITQLQVTGISTFTNGPVFIGAAISTGTASQPLQVTGGAYVSGNLGIGVTNPQQKLHVVGIVTASSYYGDGYNLIRTKQSYQFNNSNVGSGTTLNFIGAGVSSVILSNDVVTVNIPSTIRTVGLSTATLNQTTFSATYNLGFVDVYLNGSKLSQDQYTATNGTNIVLETGASLGDIVEIVGYMTYRVPGTQLILSDTVSSVSGITTSYTGIADQGSSQSASVWTIRRAVFTSAGITSSTGSASNVAWINRYSVTYT